MTDADAGILAAIKKRPRKSGALYTYFRHYTPHEIDLSLARLVKGGKAQCVGGVWRAREPEFVEPPPRSRDPKEPKRHKKQTHFGWD